MKKNSRKNDEDESTVVEKNNDDFPQQDTDTKIQIQISKRKDENHALKKLLDNLQTISPKVKK